MKRCLGFSARFALVLVAALLLVADVSARPKKKKKSSQPDGPSAEQLIAKLKPGHPRLLIDQAGFNVLRARIKSDATLKAWDQQLRVEADKMLTASLPKHEMPDGLRLLETSRRVLIDSYTLAMMVRLHGENRYATRLWEELKTVAAFPDFNPRHFLDVAEMTHALAIAYDWLYDTWSESQRATIREAIVRHGLKPGLAVYESPGGWHKVTNNWNQVCNGGLTTGALAIGDEEPKLAGQILQHAVASLPLAMHSYAPDGAWCEGPSYWVYGTTYNVVMLSALESALGGDFDLSKAEGFSNTGLFPLYMTGPTGNIFNFGDSNDGVGRMDPMFWLARRFNQPAGAWFAASQNRPTAMTMLWYHEPGKDPAAAGLPLDKYWRGVEVATMRSHWNDPKAVFVGVQSGSNQIAHDHLDLGSFVLDALGERWAVDIGKDNYSLPGYFGDQRYTYYRLRAEGHNTLVINPGPGPDQDPAATARISRFDSEPKRAIAVSDLTPAYAKHAQRVQRGIALLKRRAVLVQDEMDAPRPVNLWWFMHTPAAITLSDGDRVATLKQGKAAIVAHLVGEPKARFEVHPAKPLPSSPNPDKQAHNDNVRKLTVHLPHAEHLRMAVYFVPVDEHAKKDKTPPLTPLAEW